MTSGGAHHLLIPSDQPILIELASTEIERVRPARSRWTALFLAAFTGLTCLGLTVTTLVPRLIDRAADRGDPPARAVPAASPAIGARSLPPSDPGLPTVDAKPVVATARVSGAPGVVVRVTGAAAVSVRAIEVVLRLRGRAVARETVTLDAGATFPGTIAGSRIGVVSWTVVLPVPEGAVSALGDSRALVEISWSQSRSAPAGSETVVVSLGDGRGSG